MQEITNIFENTNSKLIQSILSAGGVILGIKIENFRGVLVNDKTFSNSLAKRLDSEIGVKGFISTDELPKYGISRAEKEEVERRFDTREGDVVVFVADTREKAEKALEIIKEEVSRYRS
jgi:Glu-tRNA(Gln) amidotransferase subunit E-like FAD-binding protein